MNKMDDGIFFYCHYCCNAKQNKTKHTTTHKQEKPVTHLFVLRGNDPEDYISKGKIQDFSYNSYKKNWNCNSLFCWTLPEACILTVLFSCVVFFFNTPKLGTGCKECAHTLFLFGAVSLLKKFRYSSNLVAAEYFKGREH